MDKNLFLLKKELILVMQKIRSRSENVCDDGDSFLIKNRQNKSVYENLIFIVLVGRGCAWARQSGGCTMCGFYNVTKPNIEIKKGTLLKQFKNELNKFANLKGKIKLLIYTSGSFLDQGEVGDFDRREILKIIANDKRIVQVDLESLPRFINEKKLIEIKSILKNQQLGISIGLESADERIRNLLINKDVFTNKEFEKKASIVKKYGDLKINLLLKPVLLTEKEAIYDVLKSFKYCKKIGASLVYIGACNVQLHTLNYYLWKNGLYTPPMLLSLLEIANKIDPKNTEVVFGGFFDYPKPSSIAMGCSKCKREIIDLLSKYQNNRINYVPNCKCVDLWRSKLLLKQADSIEKRLSKLIKVININLNSWTNHG